MLSSRFSLILVLTLATFASAQQRIGPVYPDKREPEFLQRIPQSGYDPFHWNRHTGQWNYVPIPYEPEPLGTNYNPFRFNWHSGRWDYVRHPLPGDYESAARQNAATNFVDARIDFQRMSDTAITCTESAPPIPMVESRPPRNPHVPRPSSTRPASRPAATMPTRQELTMQFLRESGHWQYNFTTGRWNFIVPGDE